MYSYDSRSETFWPAESVVTADKIKFRGTRGNFREGATSF